MRPENSVPPRPARDAKLRQSLVSLLELECVNWRGMIAARFKTMLVARRYIIGGRVQGVGFRYFVETAALREGVTGWVRNHPDRSVEVFVEGDADSIERVERQLRHGPPGARVDHFDLHELLPTGQETGFFIR